MKTNRTQVQVTSIFKTGVKNARKGGIALTQKSAAEIALPTISALSKDDGTPISLSPQQTDTLTALFYPQIETRLRVLRFTLKAAGCTLDETSEELLTRLLNPALLEKKLAKVQIAPPAINWNEMVDEEENSSSSADQDEPVIDDGNTGAGEDGAGTDNEPPAATPVKPPKPRDK